MNFDIVVARSKTGPFALRECRSLEIVSGHQPAAAASSAVFHEKLPEPCPTSMDDATRAGVDERPAHPAVRVDRAVRLLAQHVRDDVAAPQEREDVLEG